MGSMQPKSLSEIQENILLYIHKYFVESGGFYPSIRDIARAMNFVNRKNEPNPGHADHHLSVLEDRGYIYRAISKHNAIKLTDLGERYVENLLGIASLRGDGTVVQLEARRGILPYIGTIAAGSPRANFPEKQEFGVLEGLEGDNVYVMRVNGNSMIDDHICDGDYVVIKREDDDENYKDGDIIAALRDDQGIDDATLKRYYDEGHRVRLQPANSEMKRILIRKTVWNRRWKIQGKVIGIIRKYTDI